LSPGRTAAAGMVELLLVEGKAEGSVVESEDGENQPVVKEASREEREVDSRVPEEEAPVRSICGVRAARMAVLEKGYQKSELAFGRGTAYAFMISGILSASICPKKLRSETMSGVIARLTISPFESTRLVRRGISRFIVTVVLSKPDATVAPGKARPMFREDTSMFVQLPVGVATW
jgi:hypothetical protein